MKVLSKMLQPVTIFRYAMACRQCNLNAERWITKAAITIRCEYRTNVSHVTTNR